MRVVPSDAFCVENGDMGVRLLIHGRRRRPEVLAGLTLLWAVTLWSCDQQTEPKRAIPVAPPRAPRTVDSAKRPVLDAADVLQATRDSVVVVESLDRKHHVVAQGSGVIVANRTVVTAWPLISRAFAIRINHGDEIRPATVDAVALATGLARLVTEVKGSIELGRDVHPSPGPCSRATMRLATNATSSAAPGTSR